MNYRVVWRRRLQTALHHASFFAHELGRDVVALRHAVEEIELDLSDNPAEQGESRASNERVVIVNPLTIFYEVFEEQQVVLIYAAVYHPRQRL
jgi:hypothetical protein